MMRKVLLAALAGGIGLTATACEPMELGLRVRREASFEFVQETWGPATDLHLKGRVFCSRDIDVDLFLTVTQGVNRGVDEANVDCDSDDGTRLPVFQLAGHFLQPGSAGVRLRACTNPSNPIDEDCYTVERVVDLTTPVPTKTTVPPAA